MPGLHKIKTVYNEAVQDFDNFVSVEGNLLALVCASLLTHFSNTKNCVKIRKRHVEENEIIFADICLYLGFIS